MEILQPMFGMIVLSGLLVLTLFISRIGPIVKFWGKLQFAEHSEDFRPQLPRRLRLITDNHNHLMEQPTLFYATCAYINVSYRGERNQKDQNSCKRIFDDLLRIEISYFGHSFVFSSCCVDSNITFIFSNFNGKVVISSRASTKN